MPRIKRRHISTRGWNESHREQLIIGRPFFSGFPWPHRGARGNPDALPWPAPDQVSEMAEAWAHFESDIMAEFADRFVRPWGWWFFSDGAKLIDAAEWSYRDPSMEQQAEILDAAGLLSPAAIAAAAADSNLTHPVLNECYSEPFRRVWGWWRFLSPERRNESIPEAVQLVELEKRGAEILTGRELHLWQQREDDPDFAKANRIYLTRSEVEALELPAEFIDPCEDDDE